MVGLRISLIKIVSCICGTAGDVKKRHRSTEGGPPQRTLRVTKRRLSGSAACRAGSTPVLHASIVLTSSDIERCIHTCVCMSPALGALHAILGDGLAGVRADGRKVRGGDMKHLRGKSKRGEKFHDQDHGHAMSFYRCPEHMFARRFRGRRCARAVFRFCFCFITPCSVCVCSFFYCYCSHTGCMRFSFRSFLNFANTF